jgi:hypothetical protein
MTGAVYHKDDAGANTRRYTITFFVHLLIPGTPLLKLIFRGPEREFIALAVTGSTSFAGTARR